MSDPQREVIDSTEQKIRDLETHFPELSNEAFSSAAKRSLEAGQSITQTVGNQMVVVSPDGQKTVVKTVHPRVFVEAGTKIKIR